MVAHQGAQGGARDQQSGIIRFYRDHEQTLPVTMYALPNIVADSFSVEFMLPVAGETADGVEAEYFDDRIWRPLTILGLAS